MSWYYNEKGKLKGPYDEKQIITLIELEKLGADDLIFEEGARKWRPLNDVQVFAGSFRKKFKHPNKLINEAWVVLIKDPKAKKRVQKGPYSSETVRSLISLGSLSLSDYAWRPGMKQWYRLSSFPEMVSKVGPVVKEQGGLPAEELLKNVLVMKKKGPNAPDPDDQSLDIPVQKIEEFMEPTVSKLRKSERFGSKVTNYYNFLLLLAASLFIIASGFLIKNKLGQIKLSNKEVVSSVEQAAPLVKKIVPKPSKVVPAKKPKSTRAASSVQKAKDPTYIRLRYFPKSLNLKIQTDGTGKYLLFFQSKMGQIIGAKSYYRVLRRSGGELDLESLSWPRGIYEVKAQYGDFTDTKTVFIGKSGKDYFPDLAAYKKELSYDFMDEKVTYIKDVLELKKVANDLAKAKQKDSSKIYKAAYRAGSRTLKNIGPKSRNSYILSDYWLELKEIRMELRRLAKGNIETSEVRGEARKVLSDLNRIALNSQKLSLWN